MERDILIRKQEGVALVIALLMLLVLTLIGIGSITTTNFETSISGNERVRADAFYAAEAGIQVAINQVPDNTNAIPRTPVKEDSFYWSGGAKDEGSPKSLTSLGLYPKAGFDSSWAFTRFQLNMTGKFLGATKEIEAQVSYGPFNAGTQYNN
jgi:Na+-transporting methylmalonyl-CoA/oxaloacetate decarboxylase gamma subunit